jgi:hypothetical protein
VLLSAVVATPAAAATPPPVVTAADHVSGRDPLTLELAGVGDAITITTTDRTGAVASWSLPAPQSLDATAAAIDLTAPAQGEPPVNGPVALAVTAGDIVVLDTRFVLDATPPMPLLHGRAGTERVSLSWEAVRANGPVTYRLARTAGRGWTTVADGLSSTTFEDRGMEGTWYRYRLTALVANAGGALNLSEPNDIVIRVAAAAPAPTEAAKPEPRVKPKPHRVRPRKVAATGSIRGAVTPRHDRRGLAAARAAVRKQPNRTALVPRVNGLDLRWDATAQTPTVAAPRPAVPAAPTWTAPDPALPVLIPPAGMLAIDAGAATRDHPTLALLGLTLLAAIMLTVGLAHGRLPRRRRVAISPQDTSGH